MQPGNYWQVIVAERVDYAAVFCLDSLFAVMAALPIPFSRGREERPSDRRVERSA